MNDYDVWRFYNDHNFRRFYWWKREVQKGKDFLFTYYSIDPTIKR